VIHSYTLNISSDDLITWMNVIRLQTGKTQYRILENFWESQIKSKEWMIRELKNIVKNQHLETTYIFGGWFGMLGSLLFCNLNCGKIYSIDLDEECSIIGNLLNPKNIFITDDMKKFTYYENPSLIINTSTEHVTQNVYDEWYKNVPQQSLLVLQGNSFFESEEHVRCCDSIEKFKEMNPLSEYLYSGELLCPGPNQYYKRFMTIGYKK
jgi:hypothetical protein